MTVIRVRRSRPYDGNSKFSSSSRGGGVSRSLSKQGAQLLRRRPAKRSSCLGVVAVFLALVILVVVATVQKSLRGSLSGRSIRTRNTQHIQAQMNRRNLQEEKIDDDQIGERHDDERQNLQQQQRQERQHQQKEGSMVSEEETDSMKNSSVNARTSTSLKKGMRMGTEETADLVETIEEELKEEEREEGDVKPEKEVRKEAKEVAQMEQAMERDVARAEETEEEEKENGEFSPEQPSISFCDFLRVRSGHFMTDAADNVEYSNPAVLVLGMEDTSTELTWHVISQILHPDIRSQRTYQLSKHATAIDYDALAKVDAESHEGFWGSVSEKSKGKWLSHVFCQQEAHELATGFPWVTSSPDVITKNVKAEDSLKIINHLPKGAVKVIRVRRNVLDTLIRETRHAQEAEGNRDETVKLDHKQLLRTLGRVKMGQDAIDSFLMENDIPHLNVDFETLFPFDHWTDMVQVAQAAQSSPVYLHDSSSSKSSRVERAWREVIDYLGYKKPLTLFDILQKAMRTHKVHAFWIQKDVIQQYTRFPPLLQGTFFSKVLRRHKLFREDSSGDEM